MMYMTQPERKKHKIRMSVALWSTVFEIMEACKDSVPDVFAVVDKLQTEQACVLYAAASIIPPPTVVPQYDPRDEFAKKFFVNGKLSLDTIGENVIDFEALEAADSKYKTLIGSSTSIVSKDLLQTLHNIKNTARLRIDNPDHPRPNSENDPS